MRFALPNLYIADAPKPATFFGFLRHGIDEWVINARAHEIRSAYWTIVSCRGIGVLADLWSSTGPPVFRRRTSPFPMGLIHLFAYTNSQALRRLAKPVVIHANSEDDYRTKKAVKLLSEWDEE